MPGRSGIVKHAASRRDGISLASIKDRFCTHGLRDQAQGNRRQADLLLYPRSDRNLGTHPTIGSAVSAKHLPTKREWLRTRTLSGQNPARRYKQYPSRPAPKPYRKHAHIPHLRLECAPLPQRPCIEPENFDAGYIMPKTLILPKQGGRQPWIFRQGYFKKRNEIPHADLDDGSLIYEMRTESSLAS